MSVVVYHIIVPCERMTLVPSRTLGSPGQHGGSTACVDGATSLTTDATPNTASFRAEAV